MSLKCLRTTNHKFANIFHGKKNLQSSYETFSRHWQDSFEIISRILVNLGWTSAKLLHFRENVTGMFLERINNIARLKCKLKTVLGLSCGSFTHLRSIYSYLETTLRQFGQNHWFVYKLTLECIAIILGIDALGYVKDLRTITKKCIHP